MLASVFSTHRFAGAKECPRKVLRRVGFFVFGALSLLQIEIELRLPLGRVAGLIVGQRR